MAVWSKSTKLKVVSHLLVTCVQHIRLISDLCSHLLRISQASLPLVIVFAVEEIVDWWREVNTNAAADLDICPRLR